MGSMRSCLRVYILEPEYLVSNSTLPPIIWGILVLVSSLGLSFFFWGNIVLYLSDEEFVRLKELILVKWLEQILTWINRQCICLLGLPQQSPQAKWLKQRNFITSQFWRLKVHRQVFVSNHTSLDVNLNSVLLGPSHFWTVIEVKVLRQDYADEMEFKVGPKDCVRSLQKQRMGKRALVWGGVGKHSEVEHIRDVGKHVGSWTGRLCLGEAK